MLIFVVITLCKYSDFIKLITEQPLHFVYNSRFIQFIMLKVYPHIFLFSNNLIPFQRSVALSSILFLLTEYRRVIFQCLHVFGTSEKEISKIGFHRCPVEFTIQVLQLGTGLCQQDESAQIFTQY